MAKKIGDVELMDKYRNKIGTQESTLKAFLKDHPFLVRERTREKYHPDPIGQAKKEVGLRKSLAKEGDKVYNQGMKNSGAIYGAWNDRNDPYNKERERHAEQFYEAVRKRDKAVEIAKVARNSSFSEREIEQIYHHVFHSEHLLDGVWQRFAPNYDMAESWRRLSEVGGKNIQPHDIVMLHHELMELGLMAKGLSYDEAHEQTNQKYNYQMAWIAWMKEKGDL